MRFRCRVWVALAAGLSALTPAVRASEPVDAGTYEIHLNNEVLGVEDFSFDLWGDSLVVSSYVVEMVPSPSGKDSLVKAATLVVRNRDFETLSYESSQTHLGTRLRRGITFADTVMMVYSQIGDVGEGLAWSRPPGRMFVVDPQVFSLYDVIARSLHDRTFERRTLSLFHLGSPDSLMEATVTDLGTETIRWGARPVRARKLRFADPDLEFFVWLSPAGQMLRLSQPEYGLRVERKAKDVKRRVPPDD